MRPSILKLAFNAGFALLLAATVLAGAIVGSAILHASLRDTIYQTAIATLVVALVGIVLAVAARWSPLRALDRTLEALRKTKRDLAEQNKRLDAALMNMSQGLCMYDAGGRLVIFNPRFAEIYGLPKEKVVPGMTTYDLVALLRTSGSATDVDPQGTLAIRDSIYREGKGGAFVQRLTDGRSISILYRPRPGGGFVVTFEDITERLAAEERIKHLAHYDVLTDLPNRVTFYDRMESILRHLRRTDSVSVLSLDLDHFKSVNDTLGHPVGDRLLQAAADRMRNLCSRRGYRRQTGWRRVRNCSNPVRAEALDTNALAARLIEVVGAPYDIEGHQVVVGASIGIAIAPADGATPDTLMKNADLALYRAKADGGGKFRFFETEMDARMQVRRTLELELRKAILKGEFELHYQPIVEVKTGRITSCEALIRWFHPERGMIPPLEFIPIAEETSLIIPLGEWVLRHACSEAVRWPKDVTVSVNLSPAQFKSPKPGQDHRQRADGLRAAGSPAGAGNHGAGALAGQ